MATQNQNPIPARRAIASTSFDFLNGAYKKAATARLAALIFIGVLVSALVGILLYGANHFLMRDDAQLQADEAFASQLEASAELTRISSSSGLSEEDMLSHLKSRSSTALDLVRTTPDLSQLLADLRSYSPPGINIESVTIGSAAQEASSEGSASGGANTVTITALGEGYSSIKAWQDSLANIPYLSSSTPTWANSGDNGNLMITVTATIDTSAGSTRFNEINSILGETQP